MKNLYIVAFLITITGSAWAGHYNHYRGYLHSHTMMSDGAKDGYPQLAYFYGRYLAGMDFMGITDHALDLTFAPWKWEFLKEVQRQCYEPGKFVPLLGFEWSSPILGHYCVVGTREITNCVFGANTLPAFYDWLSQHPEAIATFNHPGEFEAIGTEFEHYKYYPQADDVVIGLEATQNRGFNEYMTGFNGVYSHLDEAVQAGWHVGPVSAQDNHSKDWGIRNDIRTVVMAKELTIEGIMEGYRALRYYSSEDIDLQMNFTCFGLPMGSRTGPGEKTFTISVHDPDREPFTLIQLFHNGEPVFDADADDFHGWWETTVPPDFDDSYYYAFVTQADGDRAWSSPIWVAGGTPADTQPPQTTMTQPQAGDELTPNNIIIKGTARDTGSGVLLVEVSLDNGRSYELAEGKENWCYTWENPPPGTYTLVARSRDNNSNLERNPHAVTVSVATPEPFKAPVAMAGFAMSQITTGEGGHLTIQAQTLSFDSRSVEVYYAGTPTGIILEGNMTGHFTYRADVPPGSLPGQYLLELRATDRSGNEGDLWPYLNVR